MELRNKKTGETGYYLHTHREYKTGALKIAVLKNGVPFSEFEPHEPIYDYDSLKKLCDEWEDYVGDNDVTKSGINKIIPPASDLDLLFGE